MSLLPNPMELPTLVPAVSPLVELQGFSYQDGRTVSAALLESLKLCGGPPVRLSHTDGAVL